MSESSGTLLRSVLWGSQLAVVGVVLTALSVTISILGIGTIGPLYWAGVLLTICGVSGAAIRGAHHTGFRYAGGVISAMFSVLVVGYGIDKGGFLPILVGVAVLVVSALGVVIDTRRAE